METCLWRIVISPATGHVQCCIPSLYVIHFKRALNSGAAQVSITAQDTPLDRTVLPSPEQASE
jgi:hypothetical protein